MNQSENDPFERAKKIRSGELDSELPHYEELTGWIQRMPATMLPGILRQAVVASIHKKVFVDGGLLRFVERCEAEFNTPGHGALRE